MDDIEAEIIPLAPPGYRDDPRDHADDDQSDGPPDDYFGPERDPEFASRLARGVPAGLIGVGIDPSTLNDTTHLATINASLEKVTFNPKGKMVMSFIVPTEHQLMGLAIKDAGRMQMVLAVYAPSRMARDRFGRNTATEASPTRARSVELNRVIRERHQERRARRAIAEWVGKDGPE